MNIFYSGGHTHIYSYRKEDPTGPPRTEESYNNDVKYRFSKNWVFGYCGLSYLSFFHPISGTCIDYMHTILEGVVKSLFHKWFSQDNHSNENHIHAERFQIHQEHRLGVQH